MKSLLVQEILSFPEDIFTWKSPDIRERIFYGLKLSFILRSFIREGQVNTSSGNEKKMQEIKMQPSSIVSETV